MIEIWNLAQTEKLATLRPGDYEDREFTNNAPGGDGICTFTVKRDPLVYWADLEVSRVVKVYAGPTRVWTGETDGIGREIAETSSYRIQCVGDCAKLKILGTEDDIAQDLSPGERGSAWITAHLLASAGLTAGTISTTDYIIPTGIQFYPGKYFWDCLNEIDKFNGWKLWVENKQLTYTPKDTIPTYYVRLSDCKESSLDRNREKIYNWAQYAFTPDGETYGYMTSEDTNSQSLYGKRMFYDGVPGLCSDVEAQQIADVFIAQHKRLKPSSSLTAQIVRDAYGVLVPVEEVKSGRIVQVADLLSAEETIASSQTLNELCTWELAEIKVKNGWVTLSPGAEATALDVMLAKMEARLE